jgi:plasmid stability protein
VRGFTYDEPAAAQRLAEVAEILAAGMLRLRRKQGQVPATEEQVRLDFSPERSVHAGRLRQRRTAR